MEAAPDARYGEAMTWTIPNTLTTLRLLAAPGVAVMFLFFNRPLADWCALVFFIVAALTDYFDGYLARLWGQETKFGAMLDPIADKAMVIIALLVITGFSGMNPWILLPATLIIFREAFVSGLREYLGNTSRHLKVTILAKWKTTVQMGAIAWLFLSGALEHYFGAEAISTHIAWWVGVIALWVGMALTLVTGLDYFLKSLPYLKEE